MELQADCLAGVWAARNHQLNNRLEQGDVEEGLNAAAQIGDDMIQKQQQGYVVPDSFTHGSSQQRVRWAAWRTGQIQQCDASQIPHCGATIGGEAIAAKKPRGWRAPTT